MNIIISGYGRMGKEIEKVCLSRNHTVVAIIDNEHDWQNPDLLSYDNAIVIDFSLPDIALSNFRKCFEKGLKIVTGTTGWHDKLIEVTEMCDKSNGSFFYAPNFSIGVNLFFRTNDYLSKIMSGFGDYKVHINETHHIHKVDAPSGTAIATADQIINNNEKIDSWELNTDNKPDNVSIYAFRQGEVTGKHEVIYESEVDSITLIHEAKNRSGFALGAIIAAEFLSDKTGVFNMNDLLDNII